MPRVSQQAKEFNFTVARGLVEGAAIRLHRTFIDFNLEILRGAEQEAVTWPLKLAITKL